MQVFVMGVGSWGESFTTSLFLPLFPFHPLSSSSTFVRVNAGVSSQFSQQFRAAFSPITFWCFSRGCKNDRTFHGTKYKKAVVHRTSKTDLTCQYEQAAEEIIESPSSSSKWLPTSTRNEQPFYLPLVYPWVTPPMTPG